MSTRNQSTWAAIAETPMAWDHSDEEPVNAGPRSPKQPPPVPIRVKGSRDQGPRRLPGVREAVPQQARSDDPVYNPEDDLHRRKSRMDKPTRELFVVNSFDVTVPGEGTFRVPAKTADDATQAIIAWFREDAEGGPRDIDPRSLMVVRTPKESNEGAAVGGSLAGYQMPHPEANEDELTERVFSRMLEIVRKKKGGGGYVLYSPNKGKKKKPKPVGEFPTRSAAKAAELARFPPKDSKQLQQARKRADKLRKDPKARNRAERGDLSGRKKARKSGPPAHARRKAKREGLTRALAQNIRERLFHEDELPGSAWDERISAMHPDHVAADPRLADFHKRMERSSIGSLGSAQKALARVLRGLAKVHPGDIAKDTDRGKSFMPVMLDIGGAEVGPVHLYIDGGHVKVELSGDARQQISELDPDTAHKVRGGLMTYEEDHLPKIGDARKAWTDRDRHMDDIHTKLQKHIAGMSDVERHLAKQLLKGKREN